MYETFIEKMTPIGILFVDNNELLFDKYESVQIKTMGFLKIGKTAFKARLKPIKTCTSVQIQNYFPI